MAKRSVEQFLEHFALPLVGGGEVHVGAPISVPELNDFASEMDRYNQQTVAIDDAREAALATLLARVPALSLIHI